MKSSRSKKNNPNKRMAASVHEGMASGVAKFRHSYSHSKRIIAFVLALAMVLGLVYVDGKRKEARADGETTISFGTDVEKFIRDETDGTVVESAAVGQSVMKGMSFDADAELHSPIAEMGFALTPCSVDNSADEVDPCIYHYFAGGDNDSTWAPTIDSVTGKITYNDAVADAYADGSKILDKTNSVVPVYKAKIVYDVDNLEYTIESVVRSNLKFISDQTNYEGDTPPLTIGRTAPGTYTITDSHPQSWKDGNAFYYAAYSGVAHYKAIKQDALPSESDLKTTNYSGSLADVKSELETNTEDGTYVVVMKYTDLSGNFLYAWAGKFDRDDYVDASDFDISKGGTNLSPVAENYITFEAKEDVTYDVEEVVGEGGTALYSADFKKTGESAAAGPVSIKLPEATGTEAIINRTEKSTTVKVTVNKDGKKSITKTFNVSYGNAKPIIKFGAEDPDLVHPDYSTSLFSKKDSFTIKMDMSAVVGTISSTDITVECENEGLNVSSGAFNEVSIVDDEPLTFTSADDGLYTFYVKIKNSYGIESEPYPLTYGFDRKAPTVNDVKLSQEGIFDAEDITYEDPSKKLTASKDINISFNIKDETTGFKSYSVELGSVDLKAKNYVVEGAGGLYDKDFTISIPSSELELTKGTTQELKISAEDYMGHEVVFSRNLSFYKEEITFTNVEMQSLDADRNIYKNTDGDMYTGDAFAVKYSIKSDVPISSKNQVAIKLGETEITVDPEKAALEDKGTVVDGGVTYYLYDYTYKYTENETSSRKFDSISFRVKNDFGTWSNWNDIKIIYIDLSDPQMSFDVDAASVKDLTNGDGTWYQMLILKLSGGDGTESYQSGLSELTITNVEVTDSTLKDKVSGDNYLDYYLNGGTTLKVKDSPDKNGTPVGITVKDNVGNTQDASATYYVDSKKPEATLSAKNLTGGKAISNNDLIGNGADPAVTYNIQDKLSSSVTTDTIYKYTVEIEKDGTSVYKVTETTDTEHSLLSAADKKLSELLAEKYGDGVYTLKVYDIYDRAGNKADDATPITFELDNTKPVISKAEVSQPETSFGATQTKEAADSWGEGAEWTVTPKLSTIKKTAGDPEYTITAYIEGLKDSEFKAANVKILDSLDNDLSATVDASTKTVTFTATPALTDKGKSKAYKVYVKDDAGNSMVKTIIVSFLNNVLTVSDPVIVDATFGDVGIDKASNDGDFSIEYTITSDAEVKEEGISFTASYNGTPSTDKGTLSTPTIAADGTYTYVYSFPVNVTESAKVQTTLSAEDVNGAADGPKTTDILCIDLTNPEAGIYDDDTFSTLASQIKWYDDLRIFVKDVSAAGNYSSGVNSIEIDGEVTDQVYTATTASAKVNQSIKHEDNGAYESRVTINITDNVGNENVTKSFVFHVDGTVPEIDGTKLTVDGKTADELAGLVPAGYVDNADPNVSYFIGEDVKINSYKISITTPGGSLEPTTGTKNFGENFEETKKLSTLIGDAPAQGKYTIKLDADNLVPNNAVGKEINFTIDTVAPTIDLSLDQAGDIPLTEVVNAYTTGGKRLTSTKDFSIKAAIDDPGPNGSGIKSTTVTEKIGDGEAEDITSSLTSDGTLAITANDKYRGKTVVYTFTSFDNLGHKTEKTLKVDFSSEEVKITSVRDKANETDVNPANGDENVTNSDTINITYTIKSDVEILDPTINDGVATLSVNGSAVTVKGNANAEWTVVKNDLYDYEYTLVYTIKVSASTVLSDIKFNIQNINGVSAKDSHDINILRIDITKPEISSDITDEVTWFQNLELLLTYKDGDNPYRSGVKTIKVGGVKEALGAEFFIINFKTAEYEGSKSVNVLESETKAGTKVTLDISDQLGNSADQKMYMFHVDESDPETVLRIKDTNYSDIGTYLLTDDGNPSVKYEAKDNIEVASYTFKIVCPDGTELPVTGSNTNNISVDSTLKDLIGTAKCDPATGLPKDGEYTISIEATDIAGNTAVSKSCTFILDNTTPTNDLIIQNTNPLHFDDYQETYYGNEVGGIVQTYQYGRYYGETVNINAKIEDANVKKITITDNGTAICPEAKTGDNAIAITDEGLHEIVLTTVDQTNHESKPVSLKFIIDKTAPVPAITVGGVDSTVVNNKYIGKTDTNKNPEIKFSVTEKYKLHEYQADVTLPDGTTHSEVYYALGTKDKNLPDGNFEKTEKLSELCQNAKVNYPLSNGLPQDGKYILSLKAEDTAGNVGTSAEATFYIDNTAPELSIGTIDLKQTGNDSVITRSNNGSDTVTYKGVTAMAGSESGGKFTVTFDTKDPLVNETASGLAATGGVVVTETLDGTSRNVTFTKSGDKVSFDVQANESYVGKVAEYTLKSTDAVGNSTTRTIKVSFAKDEISIKHWGFDNEATNSTNSEFTITYDIVSDVPITPDENAATLDAKNINLSMETLDGAKNKDTAGTGVLVKADSYNPEEFKYNYIYAYTINLSQSDVIKNVKVTVANNNGVVSEPDLISLINIDLTDPAIAANNPNESMWFPSLQVIFNYTEGNREYMSGVKSIKITGVKQGLDDYFESEFDNGVKDSDGRVLKGSVTVDVNESKDLNGTKVTTDIMDNLGRTMDTKSYTFHVDETNPVSALSVNGSSAADIDGTYIGTNTLNPTVAYSADDNIQIKNYALKITLPSGETITPVTGENVKNINKSTTLGDLIGKSNMNGSVPKDGTYTLTYEVYDMAGRVPDGGTITTTFTLDNTTPKNDLQITTGRPPKFDKFNSSYSNEYTGLSYSYGQYYNSSVSIDAIVVDNNVENITVTDNGSVIYSGTSLDTTHVISAEGSHTVAITTVDKAGLSAATESVTFTIDTTQPVLSTTLNNAAFPEGGATRYLNVNGDVGISYVETNKDTDDLIMTVTKNPPGGGSSVTSSKVNEGSQVFSDEADYTVKFAATDRAGNKSAERTVTFRVDRTKPELSFTGAADHGTSTKSVNMSYIVREAFYSDMNSCTLRIYKKVDGASEVLLKTVEIKPTSANYSMNELFEEDGEYRFEMTAEDKCGNPATASYTFILDGKAPIITLAGVKNYDKTSEDVTLTITVDETFFSSNKVVLKGTRIDIDGVKHDVKFSDFAANTGKISKFEQLFKEDGIYDITITSTDKAGNSSTQKIHFTKDTTDPEIKGIDDYDGTKINSFKWGTTAEEMVRDLTVCDIKVYMDGVEYDGLSDLADGSHVLRVIATDELGHTTDREVSFVLDTIAPNILIAGVEEGQYLKEATQITVSVQIDEDTLTRVTLDGKEIEIVNGVATFTVNQRGQYTIFVEAIDEAGNVATKQLNFNFGDRFPWWIFLVGAGGIFLMILLLLLARRRKDKKAA